MRIRAGIGLAVDRSLGAKVGRVGYAEVGRARLQCGCEGAARELWALFWIVPKVVIVGLLARWKGKPLDDGERPGLWYGIDMMLPGIQLSQKYRNVEISGWPKYYFCVHRLVG